MSENFNYCHVVGKTDVGRKRAANEDSMYNTITQNGLVSVVCDGMGGHVGGATASKIAISTIIENLNDVYYDDPRIAIGESIDKANRAIIQKAIEMPELTGMGSTCVLLLVRGGKVYIGHVGDSRIYLIRSKRIVQLTKDHSYVQMLVDCGEITKEQAEHHPRKNEITNALGIPNMSPATVAEDAIIPEAGDCFVLCSDGLSGMVSDDRICKIISRQADMNAQERVDRLVELANENGGVDNITVQLVEFSVSPNAVTVEKKFPTWAKITSVVSILLILSIGGYFLLREKPSAKNNKIADTESVIKCDTILQHFSEKITFKKKSKIVEFEFGKSYLSLKRENKELHRFETSFDQHSLNVCTPNVTIEYNNSLLSFTDEYPGDCVVFYITQSDKRKTYKCIFDIRKQAGIGNLPKIENNKGKRPKVNREVEEEKPLPPQETVIKIDTVLFEYDKLKDSKLLLNYSAIPTLIFNQKEEKLKNSVLLGKVLEGLKYEDLYWKKKHNTDNKQLSFEFNGENSDTTHIIEIPCEVKDSKDIIIISVKLVYKEKENIEEAPKVEGDAVKKENEETPNNESTNTEGANNTQKENTINEQEEKNVSTTEEETQHSNEGENKEANPCINDLKS